MTEENAPLAHEAIIKAAALKKHASTVESALIDAALMRYPAEYDPDDRRSVDEAFASAMADVHARFPDQTEVTTVYSIALFLLEDRRGYRDLTDPDLQKLHGLLKSVIAKDHAHPGACHLYIHATESTSQPELGLPCAETLGSAVPGASHIQHMPSHAWNEVGLWRRSVDANLKAWQADRAALNAAGFSYGSSHNLHMLVFAASFDGQADVAIQAGDDYEQETGNPLYAMLTRVRFGHYAEILGHDARPKEERDAAFYDFARGYAHLGDVIWKTPVGRGGVQGGVHFGMAAGDGLVYVPINDMFYPEDLTRYDFKKDPRPGIYALDPATGKELWANPAENVCPEDRKEWCDEGISAAATAIPGAVIAGHMDGHIRIYSAATGNVLWDYTTLREFDTVSGEVARGGSMSGSGATVTNGMLYMNSGYGIYEHMPGNVLLAFGLK